MLGDQFLQLTFFIDMLLSFRLAFHEEDLLVTDGRRIALRYLRRASSWICTRLCTLLSCRLAFHEADLLVTDSSRIALRYLRRAWGCPVTGGATQGAGGRVTLCMLPS